MTRPATLFLALLLLSCNLDAPALLRLAAHSSNRGDHRGAENYYRRAAQKQPGEAFPRANLAFALTSQNKHLEAIPIYAQLIQEGEGTYDLFAWYARSLEAAGRDREAVLWNYRALMIVPKLVDVRSRLAKLLVREGRPHEALALLASFDDDLERQGADPYFKGQILAIAANLPPAEEAPGAVTTLAGLDGHYFVTVTGSREAPLPFMIDTGATHTSMSTRTFQALGLTMPKETQPIVAVMADRRKIQGSRFTLPTLQVGPFRLHQVPVAVFPEGAPLLGQSTLERFDMSTSRHEGVAFLTLALAAPGGGRHQGGLAEAM